MLGSSLERPRTRAFVRERLQTRFQPKPLSAEELTLLRLARRHPTANQSRLAALSNISYPVARRYLSMLVVRGLISLDPVRKLWLLTHEAHELAREED